MSKLPEWMTEECAYDPPRGGRSFALKTIKGLGGVMGSLKVQRGHEKARAVPAIVKLPLLLALIVTVSIVQNHIILLGIAAPVLLYLCTWPARDIASVLRPALAAAALALVLFIPAMVMDKAAVPNALAVVGKVALCVIMVSIFNHTTRWDHITRALRQLHIPGIFVFSLDITLRYVYLLGRLICGLLTALSLRSVGRHGRKYGSVGGVMGVTFLRGTQMNREMYEAMRCRGFTNDYKGL